MKLARTTTFSSGNAGFTLIEIMISIAVGAIILTAAALCLNAAITSQRMIDPRVDTLQTARVALALISADLRGACPLDKSYAFLGSHRMVGKIVADNPNIVVSDVREVRAAGTIAHRPHAGSRRPAPLVDLDETPVVLLDPGRLEAHAFGVRRPSARDEDVRALDDDT